MAKVLLGMSGGIDSSVAALLLKEQGYDVTGVTMSLWHPDGSYIGQSGSTSCFSPDKASEVEKAREICGRLGIRHVVLDISKRFEDTVLADFRREYLDGRTPNPCVVCNQMIKFGAMVEEARSAGLEFDFFATGHYARIEEENGRYVLMRGKDPVKDQSYFLYRLSQEQLSHTIFPLGGMVKSDVRSMDLEQGYHDEGQTESQDFYSGHYSDLLDVTSKPGDIVDLSGKVLGRHNGVWNYTIGQRKGLGIAAERGLYVLKLDVQANRVVVGFEESTYNTTVIADDVVWGAIEGFEGKMRCSAKIRSTGRPADCTIRSENGIITAVFDAPVKAATRGQSLVCYDGDRVLLGGIIRDAR